MSKKKWLDNIRFRVTGSELKHCKEEVIEEAHDLMLGSPVQTDITE